MEAALKITHNDTAAARLSAIGQGSVEDRAHAAVELLLRRSSGKRLMVVGFFSTEKFRRAFRAAFESLAGPEDRLVIENAKSRRVRGLGDVARRAWLYGRLGACATVIEAGRDETAGHIISELGAVVATHNVPVVLIPGEHLETELSNGWRVSFLCHQAETNPAHLMPEQIERVPVKHDDAGSQAGPRAPELKLAPDAANSADGMGGLMSGGGYGVPQLGLGF